MEALHIGRRRAARTPFTMTKLWRGILAAALVATVGSFVLVWMRAQGAEERAIRALAPEERRALYERTLENLRSICAEPRPALLDYCREQADLVVKFPECDEACKEIAWRQFRTR